MMKHPFESNSPEPKSVEVKGTYTNGLENAFGSFLLRGGLYEKLDINEENYHELIELIGGHVKLNAYCPQCGENRVFTCKPILHNVLDADDNIISVVPLDGELRHWQTTRKMLACNLDSKAKKWTWRSDFLESSTRLLVFEYTCAMHDWHHMDFVALASDDKFMKIGQYPSLADLSFPELKEYKKVMSEENEKELKRAIGLYASGIGVGSMVYLRRIFERILNEAGKRAITEEKITKEEIETEHVDKRIKLLEDYLPKTLVDNPVFYKIISKGIHELSEEECIEYFPVLKMFIISTLRQWEKMRKDAEDEKSMAKSLGQIAQKIK